MESERDGILRSGVFIIIPVYNAANTLERCLDSLISQTYPYWTACLADDCSGDASADIARRYMERDARIQWLAAERNGGPSAARNRALARAQGEYVAFLDSDDWWEDTFLEEMVAAAERYGADFVQCGWTLEWPGGASRPEPNIYPTQRAFAREEFAEPLGQMLKGISMNHVARKLVRRELMEGLTFSTELKTAEDLLMCFQLLMRARRIAFLPRPLYHYLRHGNGLTGGGLSFRQKWDANRAVARMMREGVRDTEFDTWRFRALIWLRPYRLIASKAARILQDIHRTGARGEKLIGKSEEV